MSYPKRAFHDDFIDGISGGAGMTGTVHLEMGRI